MCVGVWMFGSVWLCVSVCLCVSFCVSVYLGVSVCASLVLRVRRRCRVELRFPGGQNACGALFGALFGIRQALQALFHPFIKPAWPSGYDVSLTR